MKRALAVIGVVIASVMIAGVVLRALAKSTTFQLFARPVAHVETTDSIVALTFDDGPRDGSADSLLGILRSRGVHATFFVTGGGIASAPTATRALLASGHELGNHTYTHRHMVFRTVGTYREEVERTDSLLHAAGAGDPIYFRPPYGYKLVGLPYVLWRMGRTTVTWDIAPESFSDRVDTPEGIVRHVLGRVQPGSIILLHPWFGSRVSVTALPALIDSLHARGYRVTTVGDLLAHEKRSARGRGP